MIKRCPTFIAFVSVWLMLLSCRPIVAIGWTELIILIVLIAVLLGPFLFRLYRFLDKIQRASQAEENKKK